MSFDYFSLPLSKIKNFLGKLSYKTGIIVLSICIPFYLLSFIQMGWEISYTTKGILWAVFFGLAKAFQYGGIAILGTEGIKRLKAW